MHRGQKKILSRAAALVLSVMFFPASLYYSALNACDDEIGSLLFDDYGHGAFKRSVGTLAEQESDISPEAPDYDEIYSVISRDFEEQAAKVFVGGSPYPYLVAEHCGEIYVALCDFLSFASGGHEEKTECAPSDLYFCHDGRCVFCENGVIDANGKTAVPLAAAAWCAGMSVTESGDELFVSGDYSPVASGSDYYNEEDLYWLSRIISCESRSESFLGKIAVGNVVLNRVASSEFPDDVKGVVFDRRYGVVQFSPAAGDAIYREPDGESVDAAKVCLEGFSLSDEILYFMNPKLASGNWISENREAVMTIGAHTFYS
ncbi:MAG: cell wall hydrolase [Clostridia bacterium]|nr:cell wall hydrolase [Clostridia bacterium]